MTVDRKFVLLLRNPDNPDLNILTEAMCEELTRFLEDFPVSDFDGLLITSEGKNFSVGADIGEHFPGKVEKMLPAFNKLLLTLATFPLPIETAIYGACHGGSLELAMSGISIIARNLNLILSLPEIKLGCFPPLGLVLLPRFADEADAIRFLLTGQALEIKNEDHLNLAESLQLVDEVFEGDLDKLVNHTEFGKDSRPIAKYFSDRVGPIERSKIEEVLKSEDMSKISTHALECAIRVLIECSGMEDLEEALKFAEDVYLNELVPHPDYTEGLTAFMEKRKPDFKATGMPTTVK